MTMTEENMPMMNGNMSSMMSMGMGIWMLLLIALVIVAIYTMVHFIMYSKKDNKKSASSYDASLNTLRERFAQGELTEDEFEQKRRVLQQDR